MAPDLVSTRAKTFSLGQRAALGIIPPLLAWCVKAIHVGCTLEVRGQEHWDSLAGGGEHFLMGFWHETLVAAAWRFRGSGYQTLISHSFDGEMAVRVITRLGMKALRGSSSEGGLKALSELAKATSATQVVAFPLDGPRGPRRVAKVGIAILAAKTRLPILPLALVCRGARRLKTWDRMPIPRPFATIVCAYGAPISPPRDATRDEFEKTRLRVETALNDLHREVEEARGTV